LSSKAFVILSFMKECPILVSQIFFSASGSLSKIMLALP
jgi:hypothetical protein